MRRRQRRRFGIGHVGHHCDKAENGGGFFYIGERPPDTCGECRPDKWQENRDKENRLTSAYNHYNGIYCRASLSSSQTINGVAVINFDTTNIRVSNHTDFKRLDPFDNTNFRFVNQRCGDGQVKITAEIRIGNIADANTVVVELRRNGTVIRQFQRQYISGSGSSQTWLYSIDAIDHNDVVGQYWDIRVSESDDGDVSVLSSGTFAEFEGL